VSTTSTTSTTATRRDVRVNRSGIELAPFYGPEDVGAAPLGAPGEPPFTRGIYPTMHRGRVWSKRQLIGIETPEAFNERQKRLLEAGVTATSLIICNSTYRGYDVDEVPRQLVGTCGSAINCLDDIRIALADLPLDALSFGLNDPTPFTVLAHLLVLAEEQGVPWTALRGTSNQSDFLSHFVANHMFLRLPPRGSLRVLLDHIAYAQEHIPNWNPVSVVGQHMQQGGATPAQALAFTLATATQYVRSAVEAGLDVNLVGRRITYFHDVSMSFFEEIAKLRAQRRMWAHIMGETFGASDPNALRFKVHTQTSGADLTRQQPLNNIVRVTVQALAAVLGGTQSLHTDAYDEALATPTEDAAKIALATQHILSDESGVPDVVDPLGGSYYVEALTDAMERAAWEIYEEVERRGGMIAACESGYVQEEIGRAAWEFQRSLDDGERVLVGVTRYASPDGDDVGEIPVPRVDPERVTRQIERVKSYRANRDQERAAAARARIVALAENPSDNAFEATIDGVRARLTHCEIVAAMREAFGFGRPLDVI
jgi:pivalyl-CoA mutase large subunit